MFYQISLICRGFIIINVKLMYPSLRNKHFLQKRQERIYWVKYNHPAFHHKTADNPSFPLLLALWSDGFATNLTIKVSTYWLFREKYAQDHTGNQCRLLVFALNSSAVATASSPSPLNHGTNVAGLLNRHQFIGFRSHKLKIASQGVRQWRWGLISMTRYFFQSGLLARQNLLARKRRLSEKSCVLGKNEQWLGWIQHSKRGRSPADWYACTPRWRDLLCDWS